LDLRANRKSDRLGDATLPVRSLIPLDIAVKALAKSRVRTRSYPDQKSD
jgi:hypothetical protein